MNSRNYETTQAILIPNNNSDEPSFPPPALRWRFQLPAFHSKSATAVLRVVVLALILLSLALRVHACGPFFPNNLLGSGDAAVLAAPVADFQRELARMELVPSRFEHVESTNTYAQEAIDAELDDLAAALKRAKVKGEEFARITGTHAANRNRLAEYVAAFETWESRAWMDEGGSATDQRGPKPVFPEFAEVPDLPGEFVDYFAGAVALRNPDTEPGAERAAWERLLARPAAERKYKSTWAAFMLGKSWEDEADDKAVEYYQRTRELARTGFADPIGLAAASLGLEARVELQRNHFRRAIELYLEQYAAGDASAVQSLQIAAARALENAEAAELRALAAAPATRSVILAHLISGSAVRSYPSEDDGAAPAVQAWLGAVEAADVKDVAAAERLALAAYQAGEFEAAQRWIKRARGAPVARWLQAKLILREGRIAPAAALLAGVVKQLPIAASNALTNSTEFADSLHAFCGGETYFDEHSARVQVLGELGVLQLSRGEFEPALDALLRSDFWEDAAYVAERVLTTDQLKSYVDREWPEVVPPTETEATPLREDQTDPMTTDEMEEAEPEIRARELIGQEIRYLLARRLTRELRGHEARAYYPAEWQSQFDELVAALDAGWNESAPAERRAKSLFAAAWIARTNGLELLGTELGPDWKIHEGQFDCGLSWEDRATNSSEAKINLPTEAELNRAAQHRADPEQRFHYRYQAAFLAWEAAKLLPNNSDETARVLCAAGTWLKNRDPETADLFYKALVRRCRKTAIGEQADQVRWFPVLDIDGNPIPYQPRVEAITETLAGSEAAPVEPGPDVASEADPAPPGTVYIVHAGDSLAAIAAATAALGQPVTMAQILEANPGLDPARLRVGRKIIIPASAPVAAPGPDIEL